MTNISQELALGLVGSFGCHLGNVQLPFQPLALGDIEDERDTLDISFCAFNCRSADNDDGAFAILVKEFFLPGKGNTHTPELLYSALIRLRMLGRSQTVPA